MGGGRGRPPRDLGNARRHQANSREPQRATISAFNQVHEPWEGENRMPIPAVVDEYINGLRAQFCNTGTHWTRPHRRIMHPRAQRVSVSYGG